MIDIQVAAVVRRRGITQRGAGRKRLFHIFQNTKKSGDTS